ncbi:MAG: hypothetical protein VKI83_02695 [Synechococcaceae cyanobacterium]|nr:hypothetical protein [Synechococcaceae cyanobacterium]
MPSTSLAARSLAPAALAPAALTPASSTPASVRAAAAATAAAACTLPASASDLAHLADLQQQASAHGLSADSLLSAPADSAASASPLDPDLFRQQLDAVASAAGWQSGLSELGDHVLAFLAEMGIPIASVTIRGVTSLLPVLRSIDWARFRRDWAYTLHTFNRLLRLWRDGGWRESCKALVLGVMLAHVPHLASIAAGIGLAGVACLGVRWLASRRFLQNTLLGDVLLQLADVLASLSTFLARVLRLVDRVVDVAIEAASRVVRHVASAACEGVRQLRQVCRSLTTSAFRQAGQALQSAERVASGLCSWVSGWFRRPAHALAL